VVLAVTLALGFWLLLPTQLVSLARNTIASALFSANLSLLSETGYFDIDASLKPLLHLWSLGVEEQFYLIWPVALWLTPRRFRLALIVLVMIRIFCAERDSDRKISGSGVLLAVHAPLGVDGRRAPAACFDQERRRARNVVGGRSCRK
jgi:hypothetical protein